MNLNLYLWEIANSFYDLEGYTNHGLTIDDKLIVYDMALFYNLHMFLFVFHQFIMITINYLR